MRTATPENTNGACQGAARENRKSLESLRANSSHDATQEPDITVGEIVKNARQVVQVQLRRWKGHDIIDQRIFVPGVDGKFHATKGGFALSPEKLPELIALLQSAEARLKGRAPA